MMKRGDRQNGYIIHKPAPWPVRLRDLAITTALWLLWGYIMMPVFALGAWIFFETDLYALLERRVDLPTLYRSAVDFAGSGLLIVAVASLGFVLWGAYNKVRFGRERNRREREPDRICCERMARSLRVDTEYIKTFQDSRYIQVYHTDSPPERDPFKPFDEKGIKKVDLLFCNDWDRVRAESSFGYSHRG